MPVLSLQTQELDVLAQAIKDYGDGAEDVINDVIQGYGAERIKEEIHLILPESGRRWKGKKPAAKRVDPFVQVDENLSVTVKSKPSYGYLYFPDDGSSTRKHVGGQEFMWRGANEAQGDIIDRCLDRLVASWWK